MIDELKKEIEGARRSFVNEIAQIQSPETLAALRERYLARKNGVVSRFLSRLKEFAAGGEAGQAGQAINQFKEFVERALGEAGENVGAGAPRPR